MMAIVQADPAVDHVVGYTGVGSGGGFGQINTGSVFVSLKSIYRAAADRSGDCAAAAEAGAGARRPPVPVPGAGYPRRRPPEQRAISVHAAIRQRRGPCRLDAATRPGARTQLGARRRKLRSAAERLGDRSRHRPRHRLAARHYARADRQYALRRIRPASGLRHLQRDQSISRGHGNRPALHAEIRSRSTTSMSRRPAAAPPGPRHRTCRPEQ